MGHARGCASGGTIGRPSTKSGERKMSGKRPLLVMKFGGTSVGDAARFRQCAEIVRQAAVSNQVIVVVSAVAGVTDLIFRTIDCARHGDSAAAAANLRRFESI